MEFRAQNTIPAATGLTDAIFFVQTAANNTGCFDLYLSSDTGARLALDRVAARFTSGGTPHSNPRYGDMWHDTNTDHIFEFSNNGVGNYWIDIC